MYLGSVSVPSGFTLTEGLDSSLAPGASDTFSVLLDTTTVGTMSGQVSFVTNDSDENPFNFTVTGSVTALLLPEVTVSYATVGITDNDTTPSTGDGTDFGSVTQGQTGITHTFTVQNDGDATLYLGSVSVPSGFTLTEGLDSSLAPGVSDTFSVRLDTASVGTKSGQVSFATNDSDEAPFNFQITGVVHDDSLPTIASISPPDDAVDVDPSANLVIVFTESMQKGTGNIVIRRYDDDSIFQTIDVNSSLVNISGDTVTINPTDFSPRTYYVQIDEGALEDLSGNAFAGTNDKSAWNFTCGGADLTFVVNSSADRIDANPGDSVAETSVAGEITLRAAVMESNAYPGSDTIILPSGTYVLSLAGAGEDRAVSGDLDIAHIAGSLTIRGAGATSTVIDADGLDRVFEIFAGSTVRFEDLTITGGYTADYGGGIANRGVLVLDRVTVAGNVSEGQSGAGIFNYSVLDVYESTISSNHLPSSSGGGAGIGNYYYSSLTVSSSTIFGNTSSYYAGGIMTAAGGTFGMTNSTVSGNTSERSGAGLFLNGSVTIVNSTITANESTGSSFGTGGGIYANAASVSLMNTLVAGNSAAAGSLDVTGGFSSQGGNLIGDGTGASGFSHGVNGDQIGTGSSPIDPLLGPLADNGGMTATHALLTGSPAIDAGLNANAPAVDQRENPRPVDGNGDGTLIVDVGAVEYSNWDFGDAPDTGSGTGTGNYNTLGSDNGPSHQLVPELYMGATVDADDGTLQNAAASADDIIGAVPDDEDGLSNAAVDLTLLVGTQPTVGVVVTNTSGSSAALFGWIDYDNDGVFDNATERAQVAVADGTVDGVVTLVFPTVPAGFTGTTYARFRLSTDAAAADPTGPAADGEVEDYVARIASKFQIVSGSPSTTYGLPGGNIVFDVNYDTSDGANSTSGLGLRMYYDSSRLEYVELLGVMASGFLQQQAPVEDVGNSDGDAATDRYILIAWAALGSDWPGGTLPAKLFEASFNVLPGVPLETTIYVNFVGDPASGDGYAFQGVPQEVRVEEHGSLDVDCNGSCDALTDGIIMLRYLFGFQGDALTDGALGSGAQMTDPSDITEMLDGLRESMLDVDDNGNADALTDGILILRYLFGFQGTALIEGAPWAGCTAC